MDFESNKGVGFPTPFFVPREILSMRRLFTALILTLLSHGVVDAADPLPDIRDINPDLTIPESTDGKLAAGRRIKCFSTTDNKQLYHVL